jgi:hypothetical protein
MLIYLKANLSIYLYKNGCVDVCVYMFEHLTALLSGLHLGLFLLYTLPHLFIDFCPTCILFAFGE